MAETATVNIKEVSKVQHTAAVKFWVITAKSEIELRQKCDTDPQKNRELNQQIKKERYWMEEEKTFETEGSKKESKVEKKEGGKEEGEKKVDYQMTENKKFQKVDNEKG